MNKKGFVLMETIVVIVVVSVALLTIFSSYNKILSKLRTENKYDTSEYIYITKYIKDYIQDIQDRGIGFEVGDLCSELSGEICKNKNIKDLSLDSKIDNKIITLYNIEKIYLLTNLNKFDVKMEENKKNSSLFDAYMIDYIKKLDVRDQDKLLIVEYKRVVKDTGNEEVNDTQGKELYERYICSLEWD